MLVVIQFRRMKSHYSQSFHAFFCTSKKRAWLAFFTYENWIISFYVIDLISGKQICYLFLKLFFCCKKMVSFLLKVWIYTILEIFVLIIILDSSHFATHFFLYLLLHVGVKDINVWHKDNDKTARIRAKPWMFRLPFKVYGAAVIT